MQFSHHFFNPNFYHVQEAFNDVNIRHIYAYGGSSSSKTYSVAQALIIDLINNLSECIVFRKTAKSIGLTVLKTFEQVIKDFKLNDKLILKQANQTLPLRFEYKHPITSEKIHIYFCGIDDPEKVKGVVTKRFYLNELSLFDLDDVNQLQTRLRGMDFQQLVYDFNPIDITHFIKEKIFDSMNLVDEAPFIECADKALTHIAQKQRSLPFTVEGVEYPGNTVIMRSTYLNNFFIVGSPAGYEDFGRRDIQTIAQFEFFKIHNPNYYNVYALGLWGQLTQGGEFYHKFDRPRHVVPNVEFDPAHPLILSFDENVVPYFPCVAYQILTINGKRTLVAIDEICLKNPKNNIRDMCNEIRNRFKRERNFTIITGDATSQKRDVKLDNGANFFTMIATNLQDMNLRLNIGKSNPPVAMRGQFINEILTQGGRFADEIDFKISERCHNLIADFSYLKEKDFGKLKEKVRDAETGQTYEKYGHTSDCTDYVFCTQFESEFHAFTTKSTTFVEDYYEQIDRRGAFL
jgi:phage terminase large subunit